MHHFEVDGSGYDSFLAPEPNKAFCLNLRLQFHVESVY